MIVHSNDDSLHMYVTMNAVEAMPATKIVQRAVKQAQQICQNKGLRFTELRCRVLKTIWSSHKPAKAYYILDQLQAEAEAVCTSDHKGHERNNSSKGGKSGKAVSIRPPTVYRTLDFLMEHGLIHKLNSIHAYVGCSHPLEHNTCYFLICTACGITSECCNSGLTEAIQHTTDKNSFKTRQVTLEIEGKCQQCNMTDPYIKASS